MTDALLLTTAQAAERLGISRRQVYRLIADHGLPTVTIGKDRRVPADGLAAWVVAATHQDEPHAGEPHDPEPRPYLVGTRAFVAKVCRLCGRMLDDGRAGK